MKILLLQGHSTNFFTYVAAEAMRRGHEVVKVNYCAGDDVMWRGPAPIRFKGQLEDLDDFYDDLFASERPDAVALYNALRAHHVPAIAAARWRDIPTWVFENGYFRPDYVTMDYFGHGAQSSLPRHAAELTRLAEAVTEPPLPDPVPDGRLSWAIQDTVYRFMNGVARRRYPNAAGLWQLPAHVEYPSWIRRAWRDCIRHRSYASAYRDVLDDADPLFVLPLQLEHDHAIQQHAAFRDRHHVLNAVVASFARHAPPNSRLAIKRHPFDPELSDWRASIAELARRHDVVGRIDFFAGGDLRRLITKAAGLITVNSTVGVLALELGKPVLVLGDAVYAVDGLTSRQSMSEFWHSPRPPDPALVKDFRRVAVQLTQIAGNCYSRRGKEMAARGAVERMEHQRVHLALLKRNGGRVLISYGVPKSGSTLSFELAKRILEQAGYAQRLLPSAFLKRRKRRNFGGNWSKQSVKSLLDGLRADEFIAVKTHTAPHEDLAELVEDPRYSDRIKIHVVFRDPRDNALSLLDAGRRSRERGVGAFQHIRSLADARARLKKQLPRCRAWGAMRNSLKIDYEEVAFDALATIERMAAHLGVPCDAPATRDYVLAHSEIRLNKGISRRHEREMGQADQDAFFAEFGDFITTVCRNRDYAWFEDANWRPAKPSPEPLVAAAE